MADRHADYLLIGGGLASANCARWLREEGAEGTILLVGREPDAPYNRPPATKSYLRGEDGREDALFRPAEWWAEQRVDLLTRTSVLKLDTDARVATLSTRETVSFDKALLATGANVRRLQADGSQLEGIHYLRTLGNADSLRADAQDAASAVLIGGSYIGTEVAASLTKMGLRATIVMLEDEPLERGFGKQAGRYFRGVLEHHGIEVLGGEELDRFEGAGERVEAVVTKSGRRLRADLVVIGAGAVPDVTLAKAAGLELGEKGGIRADRFLETSVPGIYAAGDACEFDSVIHGGPMRIEHWDVAFQQGRTAALNMLGRGVAHDVVPYFFSDLADWSAMEYVGPASSWDTEVVRGSIEDGEFSLWYLEDGRVRAALSVGRSDDLDHARRLIKAGTRADAAVLGDAGSSLAAL